MCPLILVKLPTHLLEDILNGNNKQLRGGKGNGAHQKTTNFIYLHDNSHGNSPKDRPRHFRNPLHIILPIMKLLYFGLSIVLFVSNIRVQKNVDSNHYDIN